MNRTPFLAAVVYPSLLTSLLLAGVGKTSGAPSSTEGNWPQWRGPLATGVAPIGNPPVEWSETKNIKWKVKLPGSGSGTPVVWESQVFIQTAIPTGKKAEPSKAEVPPRARSFSSFAGFLAPADAPPENRPQRPGPRGGGGMRSEKPTEYHQFALLCLDRQTGKVLWQKAAREIIPHEGHHGDHGFSSYSPVTDGKLVLAYFGSRGLHCYDMKGNLRWQKDLGRMETKNNFGEGSSPALFGNTVVINWDHEGDDFIVAFEKESGKELWRQPREEDTSWSTPLVVQRGERTEVVVSATRKVRSYDLGSGKLLWECAGLGANAIPTPVAGPGMVYAMSGYSRPALLALKLGRTGDLTGTDAIVWSLNKGTPYVASPLLYGDFLYFFSNRNGVLSCFDAPSGRAHYEGERLEALSGVYASPVGAGGKVYLVGRNGATLVLKQSPQLEVLATNRLDDKVDASPAVAGNELFLRGHEYLYCIAEK